MILRKPRILFVNEFHRLNSGYGTYGFELFSRLYKSGKYELFELAMYADPADPRVYEAPWKVIPIMPRGASTGNADPNEMAAYKSNIQNEFGAAKFEQTCLEVQPDTVISISDHWYFEYQERSAFRKCFNWVIMPACDSIPQAESWISTFINADACLTYTDFAQGVLESDGGGLIKLRGVASPAIDPGEFKPILDKKTHRQKYGLDPDALIIGMVSRNQARKLYPDLIESFSMFCEQNPQLSERAILYIQSSWPDIGYDLPRLLKKSGVSNKIFFTYICGKCGLVASTTFRDARCICPRCGGYDMRLPSTHVGLDRKQLCEIYNLFDVFVQYSIAEGFGMSQVEAAACGVPVFTVNYSGMVDLIDKVNATPIKVQRFRTEHETGCLRAYPDNQDFVDKLVKYLSLPEPLRNKRRMQTRELCVKNYNWDKTVAKWMEIFDSFPIIEGRWATQPNIHQPPDGFPNERQMSDDQFVNWAFVNILNRPDLINSYFSTRMLRDLLWGVTSPGFGGLVWNDASTMGSRPEHKKFDRQDLVNRFMDILNIHNNWENKRYQMIQQGLIR